MRLVLSNRLCWLLLLAALVILIVLHAFGVGSGLGNDWGLNASPPVRVADAAPDGAWGLDTPPAADSTP